MGDTLQNWIGVLIAFLTVAGTILYNSRKVKVDESAMVLGKWKELVEAHQSQIGSMAEEIKGLRTRVRELEEAFAAYKIDAAEKLAAKDAEIAGLKRAIAQNSQSTAYQLGRHGSGVQDDRDSETIAALDRAGHNSAGEDGK